MTEEQQAPRASSRVLQGVSLGDAVAEAGWEEVRRWIKGGLLPARGWIDGVEYRLKPKLIDFLARFVDWEAAPPLHSMAEIPPNVRAPRVPPNAYTDEPEGNCLMFDLAKAGKHNVRIGPGGHHWMTGVEVDRGALDRLLARRLAQKPKPTSEPTETASPPAKDHAADRSEAGKTADDRLADAIAWMNEHSANQKVPPKRDPMLKDCMDATDCRYRQALAAWKALPADRKRTPRQTDLALSRQGRPVET
jgi:Zn-finger nucleic acid-binding protein